MNVRENNERFYVKLIVFFWLILILSGCNSIGYEIEATPAIVNTEIPKPTATEDRIVFNSPKEVRIVSTGDFNYALAADTIANLTAYESYNVKDNNDPNLRKIFDEGHAFYIMENTNVLLFEYDDGFAKIQFLEGSFNQKAGDFAWTRKENISD